MMRRTQVPLDPPRPAVVEEPAANVSRGWLGSQLPLKGAEEAAWGKGSVAESEKMVPSRSLPRPPRRWSLSRTVVFCHHGPDMRGKVRPVLFTNTTN